MVDRYLGRRALEGGQEEGTKLQGHRDGGGAPVHPGLPGKGKRVGGLSLENLDGTYLYREAARPTKPARIKSLDLARRERQLV